MGQARNQILVLSAEAIIGIGGGWGTLTEIGLALKHDRPVVLLDSWKLVLPESCESSLLFKSDSPAEAVRRALELLNSRR
jgi:predicted Rossmann-fold nucleotide-binding protein